MGNRTTHADLEWHIDLLLRFQSLADELNDLFSVTMETFQADKGFIGHEDIAGNMRLAISRGKFYHLRSDVGFTGQVFHSERAMICDLESPVVEHPARGIEAEMAAPFRYQGKTAGVILVDRHNKLRFSESNLHELTQLAKQLCLLLESKGGESQELLSYQDAFELGKAALGEGRIYEAERLLKIAESREPESIPTLFYLGEVCMKKRLFRTAIGMFERVLHLEPRMQEAAMRIKLLTNRNLTTDEGEGDA